MLELIRNDRVNQLLYFLRMFLINIGTYLIFLKFINKTNTISKNIKTLFCTAIITIICTIFRDITNSVNCIILLITLLTFNFIMATKISTGYSIILTVITFTISNIVYFITTLMSGIPNIILNIQNDYIAFISIVSVYFAILYTITKSRLLRKGLSFYNSKAQSEFFDVLILNISMIIMFFVVILGNYNILITNTIVYFLILFSIIMFITIRKSFQVYYKQKLLIREVEETKAELAEKQKEIEKLEQENLNFSKKSHSLAHKQKALEYKLNELIMKSEIAEEVDIRDNLENISKELYDNKIATEIPKTGINQIDNMLKFMQSECVKNNIEFVLEISGNIHYMVNNIISKEDLEIMLADHIKDAIIAINHTDNINRSILVKLGIIDECYGLYIYDSGIEFKKETLDSLGKKPSTTHADEGGTGMGFMNTFDTLRKYNASLIINQIGKPSKDNYTKIIMFKFDNKNEFKII